MHIAGTEARTTKFQHNSLFSCGYFSHRITRSGAIACRETEIGALRKLRLPCYKQLLSDWGVETRDEIRPIPGG